MNRMSAIIERELRKFFRSPTLMLVSMVFPMVQLIILGNAFGGKIREARMGVVDHDRGTQSLRVKEAFDSVAANIATFKAVQYENEQQAKVDVKNGKLDAAVIIPTQFSRDVYMGKHPKLGLIVDNSDQFLSSSLESKMSELVQSLNQPDIQPRVPDKIGHADYEA